MNEATVAAAASGGRPKVSKISEAVIRIAGNSQDGIQAIGGFLARGEDRIIKIKNELLYFHRLNARDRLDSLLDEGNGLVTGLARPLSDALIPNSSVLVAETTSRSTRSMRLMGPSSPSGWHALTRTGTTR